MPSLLLGEDEFKDLVMEIDWGAGSEKDYQSLGLERVDEAEKGGELASLIFNQVVVIWEAARQFTDLIEWIARLLERGSRLDLGTVWK